VVDPATRIRLTAAGASSSSYWPRAERWALLPEAEAYTAAEAAVLDSCSRCVGRPPIVLGLSGGLDSRVLAVGMAELGVEFSAMTIGDRGQPDPDGAVAVAAELGIPHTLVPVGFPDQGDHFAEIDRDVRFKDGATRVPAVTGAGPPPIEIGTSIHGGGGELARGYMYRMVARNYREPGEARLCEVLTPRADALRDASPDAIERLRRRFAEFVSSALDSGVRGWRAAAVVTAEHRFWKLHRTLAVMGDGDLRMAFCTPAIQRCFVSLPLEYQVTDGFHRAFLERRRPALGVPAGPSQRQRVPRVARRAAARLRSRQAPPPPARVPLPAARVTEWLTDEVLSDSVVTRALGDGWAATTRAGLLAGEAAALNAALLAAAPVALERALSDLR
jgi:hypothetical protein